MKLLFVIAMMTYGGAPKMMHSVARAMAEKGNDVSIYSYAGDTSQIQIDKKIRFIPGKNFIPGRVFRHILKIFEIRKVLKCEKPDIVITFMPYPSVLTLIANIGLKSKVIACDRGDPYRLKGFLALAGVHILKLANGAVFQTEGARSFHKGRVYDISTVIPNPVTSTKINRLPLDKRKNEIAFVARFQIEQKRQDLMIEAMSIILEEVKDIRLVFYGDGADLRIVKDLAERHNISGNVDFPGRVENIYDVLSTSRMFVLTSDYEGIPNALIEAMTVGLPCVATDCSPGGARLLIENKVNGIIVPCGKSEFIADACLYMLNHPDEAEHMGEAAQKICERFTPESIYDEWEKYIKDVYSTCSQDKRSNVV